MTRQYDTSIDKDQLWESLNNAIENDYEINECLASEIAQDISSYDSYFENIESSSLVKPIQEWLDEKYPNRYEDMVKDLKDYSEGFLDDCYPKGNFQG